MSLGETAAASAARQQGRGEGLALAALAIGIGSFINLLSIEKSVLAITLAVLALRSTPGGTARRHGRMAIALALIQIAVTIAVLVVFRDKLGQLLTLLHDLS